MAPDVYIVNQGFHPLYHATAAQLAGFLRDAVIAAGNPRRGIVLLRAALDKVAPSTEFVTPMHAMLFQWCVHRPCSHHKFRRALVCRKP